jgi:putative ABC transport system permease protein
VIREALRAAVAQRVASVVCLVIVAGMCATVVLTSGRTAATESAVLATIDSAGTRAITVRAEPSAGLDSTVVDRLAGVRGIDWMVALGPATDTVNSAVPGGERVPLRTAWGSDVLDLAAPARSPVAGATWASQAALDALGMLQPAGSLTPVDGGATLPVVGRVRTDERLTGLEPLVLRPAGPDEVGAVAVLVVITRTASDVAAVTATVQSVLDITDPSRVTVTTSEDLADLRAVVSGQLGGSGRSLVLIVLGASAVLVAAILHGLVLLRRKDDGRRRALGATRALVLALVLAQTAAPAAVGAVAGTGGAALVLALRDQPVPAPSYLLALAVLAVGVAVLAALAPAVSAARRDPLTELRVP